MKKYFCILTSFIILLSCVKVEPLTSDGLPEELVVGALFRTDDSLHIVNVSLRTSKGSLTEITGPAAVYCVINGGTPIQSTVVASGDSLYSPVRSFAIPATFRAGDTVTIHVKAMSHEAVSTATVPEPIFASLEDTSCIKIQRSERTYNCSVRVFDRQEEDTWFKAFRARAFLRMKDGKDGETKESFSCDSVSTVISDNAVFGRADIDLPSGMSSWIDLPYDLKDNWSFSFSDRLFRNDSWVLSYEPISTRTAARYDWTHGYHYDEAYMGIRVLFPIGSMSKEVYHYLQAVDTHQSLSYSKDDFISEPVIIPDNIQDGIGFFGIVNVTSVEVDLPDYFFGYDLDI